MIQIVLKVYRSNNKKRHIKLFFISLNAKVIDDIGKMSIYEERERLATLENPKIKLIRTKK